MKGKTKPTAAEIQEIAQKARLSPNPSQYLDQYLANLGDTDPLSIYRADPSLVQQILAIKAEIEAENAAKPTDPTQILMNEIAQWQQAAINNLHQVLKTGGVEVCDTHGRKIKNPASIKIEMGKERKISSISGKEEKGSAILINAIGELYNIYDRFKALGVKVKKEKFELKKDGKASGAFLHFFAMEVPKGYRGNRDPLTMTPEQIEEFTAALKITQEREIVGESLGNGTFQEWQEMVEMKNKTAAEFATQCNTPAKAVNPSTSTSAFTQEQLAEMMKTSFLPKSPTAIVR